MPDALAEEAEAALAANDALEWKASIGMTWEESEVEEYISNIDTFISSSMAELESRTYAATVTVKDDARRNGGGSFSCRTDGGMGSSGRTGNAGAIRTTVVSGRKGND